VTPPTGGEGGGRRTRDPLGAPARIPGPSCGHGRQRGAALHTKRKVSAVQSPWVDDFGEEIVHYVRDVRLRTRYRPASRGALLRTRRSTTRCRRDQLGGHQLWEPPGGGIAGGRRRDGASRVARGDGPSGTRLSTPSRRSSRRDASGGVGRHRQWFFLGRIPAATDLAPADLTAVERHEFSAGRGSGPTCSRRSRTRSSPTCCPGPARGGSARNSHRHGTCSARHACCAHWAAGALTAHTQACPLGAATLPSPGVQPCLLAEVTSWSRRGCVPVCLYAVLTNVSTRTGQYEARRTLGRRRRCSPSTRRTTTALCSRCCTPGAGSRAISPAEPTDPSHRLGPRRGLIEGRPGRRDRHPLRHPTGQARHAAVDRPPRTRSSGSTCRRTTTSTAPCSTTSAPSWPGTGSRWRTYRRDAVDLVVELTAALLATAERPVLGIGIGSQCRRHRRRRAECPQPRLA
jgi:hypothetical protein